MTSTPDAKTVERFFNDNGAILDEKLAEECASICHLYSLSAEDLLYKVQANNYRASATNSEITPITTATLASVKKQLAQQLNAKPKAKVQIRGSTVAAQVNRTQFPIHQRFPVKQLAEVKQEQNEAGPSSRMLGLGAIFNSGVHVSFSGPNNNAEQKKKRAYRYMYEKISERGSALDYIIEDFVELLKAHYNMEDIADPSVSTENEVVVVGRITHDPEVSLSKIAEGAMVIESSRMTSGGARVPLKLEPAIKIRGGVNGASGFGLYPGAIAAFKGRNGGGGYFLATEYISLPPLKPSSLAQGIPKRDPTISTGPANILVASGPFTSDADLSYKPFQDLLRQIKAQERKPDVIFLVGPFVDCAHSKIKMGDTDKIPAELFQEHIIKHLDNALQTIPGCLAVLVPSVRDLIGDHVAFPQPELNIEDLGKTSEISRFRLLPNPGRCTINGISFGFTSVDTLFHLRKEEYFKRGVEVDSLKPAMDDLPTDAMANLCRHLLLQRSFYPIFPPPQDLSSEVNLDISHYEGAQMVDPEAEDYAPDVLILPSRLKQFCKTVHSTVTVNPSFLNKGTYASITILPESAGLPKERIKIEIKKTEPSTAIKSESPSISTPIT